MMNGWMVVPTIPVSGRFPLIFRMSFGMMPMMDEELEVKDREKDEPLSSGESDEGEGVQKGTSCQRLETAMRTKMDLS